MNDLHTITIPTPFPVGPVNVYLLFGPASTRVGAGPNSDEALAALRAGLAAYGYALADVRHLVITHAHPDHYGLADRVVAESGARVYSHRYNLAPAVRRPGRGRAAGRILRPGAPGCGHSPSSPGGNVARF